MSDQSTRSIDDILSGSVEDLLDLKEFKPLPIGGYNCIFDWERSENPAGVRLIFRVSEIIELANPEEAETLEPDAEQTILCAFFTRKGEDSSMGQGQLKNIVRDVLQPTFGGDSLIETLDNSKGAEVKVFFSHRPDKNDPDKKYAAIKSIELA